MECAAWPCRQGPMSLQDVRRRAEIPARDVGPGRREFAARASAKSAWWIAQAVAAVTPGMAAGTMEAV